MTKIVGRVSALRIALISIITAASVAAYFHLSLMIAERQGEYFIGSDSFSIIGRHFFQTGTFNSAYRPPLYPIFLGALMAAFPDYWQVAAVLIQGVLGVLCALLVFMLVRYLGGERRSAIVALLLFAAHPLFQLEVVARRETVLFTVVLLGYFILLLRHPRPYLALGMLAGIAHLLRPNGMLLEFAVLALALSEFRNTAKRRILLNSMISLAAFLVVIFPWQATIYRMTGMIQITSSITGTQTRWKGHNPYFTTIYPYIDVDYLEPIMYSLAERGGQTVKQKDAELDRLVLEYIMEDPAAFLKRTLQKFLVYLAPFPTPLGKGNLMFSEGKAHLVDFEPRNRWLSLYAILYWIFCSAGLLRLVHRLPEQSLLIRRGLASLLVIFLLYTAVHSLSYAESRYRLPLDIVLLPFVALGASRASSSVKRQAESPSPDTRKHFAIFLPSLGGGGAERAMLLFAEELHALGHRVDLILVKAEGAYQNLLPAGVRVFDLGCRRTICALPAVVRYLRLEHPQAIYSTIPHANLLTLIAAKISRQSTKVIVRESNVPITALSLSVVSKIVSKLSPLAYTWADAIIAVSEGVAHELTSLNPKLGPKIKVLPTPVVSSRLDELAGELPAHAWLGDSRVPFILAAGRLHPQKDFATLLRAFTRVRSTTDVRLIILGEGKERRFLESLAEELGITDSISMPGFVENPFPYLKQARTFVLSSRYEGMPNVLIQAMAFGTPVVATDCPGGAAEILRRGDWGVVVPVGDCLALSQAILSSLQSPRRLDAAKFVHENYSVSRSTLEYLKVSGA